METIICDISAFEYWRIPPVVHVLLNAGANSSDSAALASTAMAEASANTLRALSEEQSPWANSTLPSGTGKAARRLREVAPLLIASNQQCVDILVRDRTGCHASSIVHPRVWSRNLPFGATVQIAESVHVATPAFALLQIAARASLAATIMLAAELCGSFAVYDPPPALLKTLQTMERNKQLPVVGGWRPFVDQYQVLAGLWSRPPLLSPGDLETIAETCESQRGRKRLQRAAQLVLPNAASPFEVQASMLLGLPRHLGGEGHNGLTLNKKIVLSADAQMLAQREHCYCDLYWEEGLDLECQSAMAHDREASFLSDSDRTAALRCMGIDVIPVTFSQVNYQERFDALSRTIASMRGRKLAPKTVAQRKRAIELRSEVLRPWSQLCRALWR